MSNSSDKDSKPDIIDNHLSFISQHVQSLKSEAQSIKLDAIIEMIIKKTTFQYIVSKKLS